jgi:hypothetical protein
LCYYAIYNHANSGVVGQGQQKQQQSMILTMPVDNFGQQHLNGAANQSAAKDGRIFATLPTDC